MTRPKLRVIQGGAAAPKGAPAPERTPAPERAPTPARPPRPGPAPDKGGPLPIVLAVLLMGGLLMLLSGDPLLGVAMVLVGVAGFLSPPRSRVTRQRSLAALGLIAVAIALAAIDIALTLVR